MISVRRNRIGLAAVAALAALTVSACSGGAQTGTPGATPTATIEVQDARGTVAVPVPAERIAATDNRVFRTLDAWSVDLVAAPKPLLPKSTSYANDADLVDLGSHNEPNMEGFVAANPDVVLNGQRFATRYDEIKTLVPEAAVVDTNIDVEKKPLDQELKRQVTLLGDVLDHKADADKLNGELDASIDRVKKAYNSQQKVMGLLTSGGDISYVAPVTGRSIGAIYPLLGLTPALEQAATDVSHGDDISVEAIAAANPDWLVVLDRDAAVSSQSNEYKSAKELIEGSEALRNVTAVQQGNIVYLPADFYVTEDIQAYTALFNSMADAMEKKAAN